MDQVQYPPSSFQATQADMENPRMVDFITRYTDALRVDMENRPDLRIKNLMEGGYAVVYIPEEQISQVTREIGPVGLSTVPNLLTLVGQQDLEASGISQVQQQPYLDLQGQGTLVGFVDTGIDYTNTAFRYEDGSTKVRYLWDQTVVGGAAPPTHPFGAEYTAQDINEALQLENPFERVPQRDSSGHGTFLASVAASRQEGEYLGAAPDAEIIMVKLRRAKPFHLQWNLAPPDQEYAYSASDLIYGVDYIVSKAVELGMPASICIGLGSNFGSHDGFDVLDEYLTQIANRTGIAVCVAVGNEALARHHASGVLLTSGTSREIEVEVQGNIQTGGTINLQLWNNYADLLSVSVTSPLGEVVGRLAPTPGVEYRSQLVLENAVVTVRYFYPHPRSGSQLILIQVVNATPGVWRVTVYGDLVLEGEYNAWLPITGLGDPGVSFLAPTPNVTVTVPSTALGVIKLGGYNTQNRALYADSSWGPTRLPMLAPDLSAPAVDVRGIYPAGYGAMTGTSVAAAITAGACALLLQWGVVRGNEPTMNSYLIRSYLIRGCERDPGVTYPNEQWGYGRLNLMNTFIQRRAVL